LGSPETRAETAQRLRDEARQVLSDTGLFALLTERFGEPTVTGSAGYDLMVWRDIDIHLAFEGDRWLDWMAFGGELAAHFDSIGLGLHKATYINDYIDPHHPEALVYHVDASGTRTLEAAMFILPNRFTFHNLPDVYGPLVQFHIHDNLCFTNDPVAPQVAGITSDNGPCNPPLVNFHPNVMMHVWIRPNPCGPFAALEGVGAGQTAPGTVRACDRQHGNRL